MGVFNPKQLLFEQRRQSDAHKTHRAIGRWGAVGGDGSGGGVGSAAKVSEQPRGVCVGVARDSSIKEGNKETGKKELNVKRRHEDM